MKKTLLLSVLLFCFVFSGLSQPPILTSKNTVPKPGEIMHAYEVDTTGVIVLPDGANTTWDYSSLKVTTSMTTLKYAWPDTTPYFTSYKGSNLASMGSNNNWQYYLTDSTQYSLTGLITSGIQWIYKDPNKQFAFPLKYNDHIKDTFTGIVVVFGDTAKVRGSTKVEAGGWGTLKLPKGKTFRNILKLTSHQYEIDSFKSLTGTNQIDAALWYDGKDKNPLLQISVVNLSIPTIGLVATKTVIIADFALMGIAGQYPTSPVTRIFPNPADKQLHVVFNLKKPAEMQFSLISMLSQQTVMTRTASYHAGSGMQTFNVSSLPAGLYILKIGIAEKEWMQKVMVK